MQSEWYLLLTLVHMQCRQTTVETADANEYYTSGVLQNGADYTLGGVTHVTPITIDSTYILTAARSDIGIIDIGNPQMPKQVVLLEDEW